MTTALTVPGLARLIRDTTAMAIDPGLRPHELGSAAIYGQLIMLENLAANLGIAGITLSSTEEAELESARDAAADAASNLTFA